MSAAAPPSAEAIARKRRTESALKAQRVPTLHQLPVICDSTAAKARSLDEIVLRIMVAARVQGLGSTTQATRATVAAMVREEMKTAWPQLWGAASESEKHFLSNAEKAEESLVNLAAWKAETVWVLLWAIHVVDELPLCPSSQCALDKLPNVDRLLFASNKEAFLQAARDSLYVKGLRGGPLPSGTSTATGAGGGAGAGGGGGGSNGAGAGAGGGVALDKTAKATPAAAAAASVRITVRPLSELLEAADRIYRWHWAVRQYRFVAKVEAGAPLTTEDIVMNGVTEEWHRALNWLISTSEWDLVDTST